MHTSFICNRIITRFNNSFTITTTIWFNNNWSLISVQGGTLTINGNGSLIAKENDCEFMTTGDQCIPLTILEKYKTTEMMVMEPKERRGPINEFWICERPLSTKNYMISADCSRGDGSDYSAFHVFDLKTMEQVAEYKGKIITKEYGNILVAVATEYNDAFLVIENNNVGWATVQQVIDRNYRNLYYGNNKLNVVDIEKSSITNLAELFNPKPVAVSS